MQSSVVSNGDGTGNVTVFVGGKVLVAHSDHPQYNEILRLIQEDREIDRAYYPGDVDAVEKEVIDCFDITPVVAEKFQRLSDQVSVANGRVYFDGDEVDSSETRAILRFLEEGKDFGPIVKFYEKVRTNPSENSKTQLFNFLESIGDYTITHNGDLILYKGLSGDKQSVHSGKAIVDGKPITGRIPNEVGSIIEMPRSGVADNPNAACSTGLHAASIEFARSFGAGNVVSLIVHPRDVVSVPHDHNAEKVRVCRYKVNELVEEAYDSGLYDTEDDSLDW